MRFIFERVYKRQYRKLSASMHDRIDERLLLLLTDASNPLLNNHKLNPPYEGFSSINITGDFRLVYKKIDANTYFLRAIGTHHQLYR